MKINLKVSLLRANDVVEVRKCHADDNFISLALKLETLFPAILGQAFTIFWKDLEGDMVTLASDEDLNFAVSEMSGTSLRLFVRRRETLSQVVHEGVSCDNCSKTPIVGFRYKCMECVDYDLCGECENKQIHPEHRIMRISTPLLRFGHEKFFKRRAMRAMRQMAEANAFHTFGAGTASSEEENNDLGECPFVCEKRRKHSKMEKEHHHKMDWHSRHERKSRHGHHEPTNYLETIGQVISNILQPLGVAVEVNKNPEQAGQKTNANQQQPSTSGQNPEPNANQTSPTAPSATANQSNAATSASAPAAASGSTGAATSAAAATPTAPNAATPEQLREALNTGIQQITKALFEQHVDAPEVGWTVLNSDNNPEPSPVQPTSDIVMQEPAPPANTYPDLTPRPEPHPNVMIQRTLEVLERMGYSNETGLLTQILEIHNGDLYKALDVLAVIKK